MTWGSLSIGRISVRETFTLTETVDSSGVPSVQIAGQETAPTVYASVADVQARQADLLSLLDKVVPFAFSDKTEHSGYYRVTSVDTDKMYWIREAANRSIWTIGADYLGPDNASDVESRLSNVIRANDFSLTGTRWHAPPIGHYGYFTGSTLPSGSVTRTGTDGAMTVWLGVPAAINPRWGCAVGSYLSGRVRLKLGAIERAGVSIIIGATGWTLDNGLLRISPLTSGGQLLIESWDSATAAWEGKQWHIAKGGATTSIGSFDSATVLKNDIECVALRLMRNGVPGRTLVDLTLRRGARFVEVYVQTDSSTTLGAYLNTNEASTNGTGVNVVTSNDAQGNKAVIGSPRSYTANANGGMSKAAVTAMSMWIGSVVGGTGAVAGDAATDLRDQYIGAMAEAIGAGKR